LRWRVGSFLKGAKIGVDVTYELKFKDFLWRGAKTFDPPRCPYIFGDRPSSVAGPDTALLMNTRERGDTAYDEEGRPFVGGDPYCPASSE
jgi:hypothetical protein